MKEILQKLFQSILLSSKEAYDVMINIGEGKYTPEEIASFLTVFNMREIKAAELLGFRNAMVDMSIKVSLEENAIDIVGTGGDGKDTFNISTLSAFVVAGAGYKVVKHGNYSASSVTGSSHMMEYFGYKFSNFESKLSTDLEKANLCFLHAPLFHPAMKHIAPVRKSLAVKTIFNIMGPLINPASPKFALYGTYNQNIAELYHQTLKDQKTEYTIINSLDGYDEISLTDKALCIRKNENKTLLPSDFGFNEINPLDIKGGIDLAQNAKIFLEVLEGNSNKERGKVVVANAALAIQTLEPKLSLMDCVEKAKESLEDKKALNTFRLLMDNQ